MMKNEENVDEINENQRESRGLRLIPYYEQRICDSNSTKEMKRYIDSH